MIRKEREKIIDRWTYISSGMGYIGKSGKMAITLKTHELSKRYDEVQAAKNLMFSVEKGSLFWLLGPYGSKKSTTKMMNKQIKQASGTATVQRRKEG